MDVEEHRQALLTWRGATDELSREEHRALSEALYSFSERGLLDDLRIEPALAMNIYTIIKRVLSEGFPDELKM